MKVFGIGLNKTGTTTLGHCFQVLGYKHLSFRRDLMLAFHEGRIERVFQAIDRHESFEDWPYPLMYRALLARYPEAKFVLTIRKDPETWLRSLRRHALVTHPKRHSRKMAYGFDYPFHHDAAHLALYRKHIEDVTAHFAEHGATERLLTLCWDTGDGWPELARFLDVAPPDAPIPRLNPAPRISWFDRKQLANRWHANFWGRP